MNTKNSLKKNMTNNYLKKNVVAGLGEIGKPILQLISKTSLSIGYDINTKSMDVDKFHEYENSSTFFLHICIPYTNNFISDVISLYKKFRPEIIIIHST